MQKKSPRTKYLEAFQKLRRLEESTADGYCSCITCGKVLHYSHMHGGHFIERGDVATESDPDNVWPQCPTCNAIKGGCQELYRVKLIQKIGEARVKRLENIQAASKGSLEAFDSLSWEDKSQSIERPYNYEYDAKRLVLQNRIRQMELDKRGSCG